jgi:hypothetical protein
MNAIRVMRYLGMSLVTGCSTGLIFTIVFMLLLPIEAFQAFLAIAFFASLASVGFFAVSFDYHDKEAVT